ncbi:Bcl2/Adenovirus E1B 19 Kda Protein-Interacting Protein 3 [Manis pentadactyla]|nr:Bcl2/Adenovirus E1B 19 Kda Protein-Interacting Protein 3 [Manis pentadactyla]
MLTVRSQSTHSELIQSLDPRPPCGMRFQCSYSAPRLTSVTSELLHLLKLVEYRQEMEVLGRQNEEWIWAQWAPA